MVFGDRENAFIDNIIKGASNEDLFKLESQAKPSGGGSTGPTLDAPQRENTVTVEGNGNIKPFELPDGVVPKTPEQKVREKVFNDGLNQHLQTLSDLGANYQDISKEVGSYKDQMTGNLDTLKSAAGRKYQVDPDLQTKIDKAYGDVGAAKVPDRDLLSQSILSFAPGLFGSLTGESGQISQQASGEKARNMYETQRREDVSQANAKNSLAEKRYEQLLKIKNSGQEAFTKAQQLEMDRLRALITGTGDLLKAGVGDQEKTQSQIVETKDKLGKGIAQAGQEYAKGEEAVKDRDAKLKAAAMRPEVYKQSAQDGRDERIHVQNLNNLDKDPNMRKYRANYGNLEQARTKLLDPNILKTPELLQDVQRLVTTSMGATGGSGIDERKAQNIIKGTDISLTEFKSMLTTSPQAVTEGTRQKMTDFFMKLLNNEKVTTRAIMGSNINALTAGKEYIYDRRPDLKQGLMNKIKGYDDFASSEVSIPQVGLPQPGQPPLTREQKIQLLKAQGHK
jgi:hypothetical protein